MRAMSMYRSPSHSLQKEICSVFLRIDGLMTSFNEHISFSFFSFLFFFKENQFRKQILSIIYFSIYAHPPEWSVTHAASVSQERNGALVNASLLIGGGIISFEQLGSCRAAGSYGKTFSKTAESMLRLLPLLTSLQSMRSFLKLKNLLNA